VQSLSPKGVLKYDGRLKDDSPCGRTHMQGLVEKHIRSVQ